MDPVITSSAVTNHELTNFKKAILGKQELIYFEQAYRFSMLLTALIFEPEAVDIGTRYIASADEYYAPEDIEKGIRMRDAFLKDAIGQAIAAGQGTRQQRQFNSHALAMDYEGKGFSLPAFVQMPFYLHAQRFGGAVKATSAKSSGEFVDLLAGDADYDRAAAWAMDISGSEQYLLVGISKVNFKVWPVMIRRGDDLHLSGRKKYAQLAHLLHKEQ